jgi:hypothetical protein
MSPAQHRQQAQKLKLQVNKPLAQKLAGEHEVLAGAIENRLSKPTI